MQPPIEDYSEFGGDPTNINNQQHQQHPGHQQHPSSQGTPRPASASGPHLHNQYASGSPSLSHVGGPQQSSFGNPAYTNPGTMTAAVADYGPPMSAVSGVIAQPTPYVSRSRVYAFVVDENGSPIELGSGRFAKAYLGEERWVESKTTLRRPVALKCL